MTRDEQKIIINKACRGIMKSINNKKKQYTHVAILPKIEKFYEAPFKNSGQ